MKKLFSVLLCSSLLLASVGFAGPNLTNDSLDKAITLLRENVHHDHALTFYCEADFSKQGELVLPSGVTTRNHEKVRLEWGHIVPVASFGPEFSEWVQGHSQCLDNKGIVFKGIACVEKTNEAFRMMRADMYNIYPMIDAVKNFRGDYNFGLVSGVASSFGTCQMKIGGRRVEPPVISRGQIARTYKYMAANYPQFSMSSYRSGVMDTWDNFYPVSEWECTRAKRIEALQGNENSFVKNPCQKDGLWKN